MAGVGFKKTFSYAGFEMQPKRYEQPKIALLNIELELKAEKANAELRIDNVEVCVYESLPLNYILYYSILEYVNIDNGFAGVPEGCGC